MKTNSINSTVKPAFAARLACSQGTMKTFVKNKADANTREITLKIAEAFAKHPSDAVIKPDIVSKNGIYGTRGTISSRLAIYKDVEPVENDGTTPIKTILRRILDPENKNCFNKLVGERYSDIYDSWWNENISPIWDEINKNFRTKTMFKGNHDKDFNQDFQDRKERTWYRLLNEQV